MNQQEKFDRISAKHPHVRRPFFARPHVSRREWFKVLGAGVTASVLAGKMSGGVVVDSAPVSIQGKAKNVIFILMAGAPSAVDTFDFKMYDGVTPADFNPTKLSGIDWPVGLLPKLATHLPELAIVRSMRAWAAAHQLSQHWVQIGRNPAAALGDIAPNIGSIVAIEKEAERRPGQVLPSFIGLNADAAIGSGYLAAQYDPMRLAPSPTGIPNTSNPDGQSRFGNKSQILHTLDGPLRRDAPNGQVFSDWGDFAVSAESLMYNPDVQRAFNYTTDESAQYGNTSFGNACLLAQKVLGANLGTRFIQIIVGGWDMHQNIYGTGGNGGLYTLGKTFDNGVSALLADLKATGQLDQTLLVFLGEFGRTTGKLTANAGRDHYLQQFCAFAGAGVVGGRAIGSTDDMGSATLDPGWSRQRDVKPEDVEATIYSAMGINWTNIRYDDPFGRGFEYVPFALKEDRYGPINELWNT